MSSILPVSFLFPLPWPAILASHSCPCQGKWCANTSCKGTRTCVNTLKQTKQNNFLRFIDSKEPSRNRCTNFAWGMGCGGWRQSPELLLDHIPFGSRTFSMHRAEQAAIAQPAMGLWQQQSMRSGEGKVCSTKAEQRESAAQRIWALLQHCPGLSSPMQGQDNHEHGAGASSTGEEEPPSVDYSIFQGIWLCKGCASGVHQSRTVNTGLCPQQRKLSKLWYMTAY